MGMCDRVLDYPRTITLTGKGIRPGCQLWRRFGAHVQTERQALGISLCLVVCIFMRIPDVVLYARQ